MFEVFTAAARQVIALAAQEARRLGHQHLSESHLALGLLRVDPLPFEACVASVPDLWAALEDSMGAEVGTWSPKQIPFTENVKRLLELAVASAKDAGAPAVVPAHLLTALVTSKKSAVAAVWAGARLPIDRLLDEAMALDTAAAARVEAVMYARRRGTDVHPGYWAAAALRKDLPVHALLAACGADPVDVDLALQQTWPAAAPQVAAGPDVARSFPKEVKAAAARSDHAVVTATDIFLAAAQMSEGVRQALDSCGVFVPDLERLYDDMCGFAARVVGPEPPAKRRGWGRREEARRQQVEPSIAQVRDFLAPTVDQSVPARGMAAVCLTHADVEAGRAELREAIANGSRIAVARLAYLANNATELAQMEGDVQPVAWEHSDLAMHVGTKLSSGYTSRDQAERWLRRAMELGAPYANGRLATLLAVRGQHAEAENLWATAADNGRWLYPVRGWTLMQDSARRSEAQHFLELGHQYGDSYATANLATLLRREDPDNPRLPELLRMPCPEGVAGVRVKWLLQTTQRPSRALQRLGAYARHLALVEVLAADATTQTQAVRWLREEEKELRDYFAGTKLLSVARTPHGTLSWVLLLRVVLEPAVDRQALAAEAEREARAALELTPNHPADDHNLALALCWQGRHAEALAPALRALEALPAEAGVVAAAAWARFGSGDVEGARLLLAGPHARRTDPYVRHVRRLVR